jgi:5-methylcytosine-specific restriction protein A
MEKALFINGVFASVLQEIIEALKQEPELTCYLQPYSNRIIKELEKSPPYPESPMRLYISTTEQLDKIVYQADIVGWEDKRFISPDRREDIDEHIKKYQPKEGGLYYTINGKECCVNLILIKYLKKLQEVLAVENLIKVSDKLPMKKRSRAGGWSYVYELKDI